MESLLAQGASVRYQYSPPSQFVKLPQAEAQYNIRKSIDFLLQTNWYGGILMQGKPWFARQ